MKTVTVYRRDGSEVGTVGLPDDIFGIEPSMTAVHQVVKAHLANRRQGNASTKTRSEVNTSKSKMYRQKGTGRARAGSANSPVWVGGGIAFGPKPRTYRQKINRTVRRLAMKSAFSIKAMEDNIKVVENFTMSEPKTKDVAAMVRALGLESGKTIFLYGEADSNIFKSSRNIPQFQVKVADDTNTYEIMNSDVILIMESALDRMKEVFAQ